MFRIFDISVQDHPSLYKSKITFFLFATINLRGCSIVIVFILFHKAYLLYLNYTIIIINMQQIDVEKYGTLKIRLSKRIFFLIDSEDYKKVRKYSWYPAVVKKKKGSIIYVKTIFRNKHLYLHNLLVKKPKHKFIDHINRNGLDNRKQNLRVATKLENMFNRLSGKKNKTGYIGVLKNKRAPIHPYYGRVTKNGKSYVVGYYKTAIEAAIARDKKAKELHGEFAMLNFKK